MKIAAFLVLLGVALTSGNFVVKTLLEEVVDQDNRLNSGGQCDYFDVFGVQCDMKINVCIEPLQSSSTDNTVCLTGWKETNIIQSDSDDDILSIGQYGDWRNPDRHIFQGNYAGVRVKYQIFDANFDNAPDALIDQNQLVISDPIGTSDHEYVVVHQRQPANGQVLQPTKLRFQFSVNCEPMNSQCSAQTQPPPTQPPPTTQPPTSPQPQCNLKSIQFDILEITDASSNMGQSNYNAVVSFLKQQFIPLFNIGTTSGKTEFSSGFYASTANAWLLWFQQTPAGISANLDKWSYVGNNAAVLDSGLSDELIVTQRTGFRSASKHVAIIFGPGINTGSNSLALSKAASLRRAGVTVLAVAIGARSPTADALSLLNQVTGSSSNVLNLGANNALLGSDGLSWLQAKLCSL